MSTQNIAGQDKVDGVEGVSRSVPIAEFLSGRDNNLNLIRMLAAFAVLLSHSVPISLGADAEEPLEAVAGMSLGALAVAVFFSISGLLIARSFDRTDSLTRFVLARILRLFPALLVVLVLTVIAGAAFTTLALGDYISARGTWTYIPRNLSLAFLQYPLPGVFENNPVPGPINGSLWTLFYEVACYGMVLLTGLMGMLRRKVAFGALFVILIVAYGYALTWQPDGGVAYRIDRLAQMAFPFSLGMAAYVWRDSLKLDWRIAALLWLLCIPGSWTEFMPAFVVVTVSYTIAWLAYRPKGAVLAYNRIGDYSYGIYVYAYPIQQGIAFMVPEAGPFTNIALAAPLTLVMAMLSWHWVEERSLAAVRPLAVWFDDRTGHLFQRAGPAG